MGFFNKYPYTDFHEMNLDWFLEQFKNLVSDWDDFKTYMEDAWDAVKNDWETLYNYVHDYFDNLDVQAEIDAKLDAMLLAGQLDAPIASAAGDWLSANLATPSTPPLDTTLSVASAAAESKTVGDALKFALMGEETVVSSTYPILSDADNADINRIYTIAESGMVSNLPSEAKDQGTLITMSFGTTANGGNMQFYIDFNGILYHRMRWGAYPGTWGDWKLTSNGIQLKGHGTVISSLFPDLSDANDAEINVMYTIAESGMVSNLPANAVFDQGTLITFGYDNNQSGGNFQLYIEANGFLWQRMRWGAYPGTWGAWKLTSNGFGMRGHGTVISTTYPDLSDANDADINKIYSIATANMVANLPADASTQGGLVTFGHNDAAGGGNFQIYVDRFNKMYHRMRWGAFPGTYGAWQSTDNPYSFLTMFKDAAVLGDSYACGCIDQSGTLMYSEPLSWPKVLGRRSNVDIEYYAKGGVTAGAWLTDSDCAAKMAADSARQLYIIALGINDGRLSTTIGTIADVSASPHPNTFYGNMAEIHDQVMAKNPDAIVCFVTCMRFTAQYTAYSAAIRNLASYYGDLLIDCDNIPYLQSSAYTASIVNGHPTSYAYATIAQVIEKEFSNAVVANPTKMKAFYYT